MHRTLLLISLALFVSGCNVAFEPQGIEPVDDTDDAAQDMDAPSDASPDSTPTDLTEVLDAMPDAVRDVTDVPSDIDDCDELVCGDLELCVNGQCVPCPGAIACGACIPEEPCDPTDPDLLGCWTFDSDDNRGIVDSSLYGHDGVPTPFAFTYEPAIDGMGLEFNGADNGVSIARTSVLEYDDRRPFTVDAWVRVDAVIANDERMGIVDHDARYGLFALSAGFSCWLRGTEPVMASEFKLGEWTHVACAFDGTTLRLYQDGVEMGSASDLRNAASSNDALQIGANSPSGDGLVGAVDNVRIINRGLTPAEVCTAAARRGP